MNKAVTSLALLAALAGCDVGPGEAGTELSTTQQVEERSCDEACEMVGAALRWLVEHEEIAPDEVLLDPDANGARAHELSRATLEQVATGLGVGTATRVAALDCHDDRPLRTPREPRCHLRGGALLVQVDLRGGPSEGEAVLRLSYVREDPDGGTLSGVYTRTYDLELQEQGPEWRVAGTRLAGAS